MGQKLGSTAAALVVCFLLSCSLGQARQAADDPRIEALLDELKSGDEERIDAARGALFTLGPRVDARLVRFLDEESDCFARVAAVEVLAKHDSTSPQIESTLEAILDTPCYFWSPTDFRARRWAAIILVSRPGGIDALSRALAGDSRNARSAAMTAMEELTESPGELSDRPDVCAAILRAIPTLRRLLADNDKMLGCGAQESLEQLATWSDTEISRAATKALASAPSPCDELE